MQKKFYNQMPIKSQKQCFIDKGFVQNTNQRPNEMRKMIENYSFGLNDIIYKNNFCKVYTGIDIRDQKPVAIKAVELKSLNEELHHQLQSQIKYVKSLPKNNYLVNVFDIFCTSNNCYFIMQLCKIDLKSYLKRKKVLSQEEFYPILIDIIDGISFLQQNNYIHCNLKPSNILLSKNGSKLTDFSKCQKIKLEQDKIKQSKQWNPYMCPDTLLTKKYSMRNDLWALGVITYQCLHGYHMYPWKFTNYQELLQRIYQNNIKFSPTLSQKTVNFILKCLNSKLDLSIQQLYQDKLIYQLKSIRKQVPREANEKTNQLKINLGQKNLNKNFIIKDELQLTSPHLQKITSNGYSQTLNNIKNQDGLSIQHCIESEINFMRFIYIIYQFQHKNSKQFIRQGENKDLNVMLDSLYFKTVLIKQILIQRQNLKLTFRKYNSEVSFNPFNFQCLNTFFQKVNNQGKIIHYKNIIEEYNIKYQGLQKQLDSMIDYLNKQIKPNTFQWRSKDILNKDFKRSQVYSIFGIRLSRDKCKFIWKQIQEALTALNMQQKNQKSQKLVEAIQSKALHLDFMLSYYLINCLLIDDFNNPIRFSKYNGVKTILNNKPTKLQVSLLWMLQDKLKKAAII